MKNDSVKTSTFAVPSEPYTVRLIGEESSWTELEPAWNELFTVSPTASPSLRWDWLREWWRIYGPTYADAGGGLRIYTTWRGPALVAAAPLYIGRRKDRILSPRRLGFISTGEAEFEETCAEYLDLMYRPAEGNACAKLIGAALDSNDWEELELAIQPQSPLMQWGSELAGRERRVRVEAGPDASIADLTGGFEAYLQRLSSNSRWRARRLLRAVAESGVEFEFAEASTDVDHWFDQLVSLHQERWTGVGKSGCFASPRFSEFHRSLVRRWLPSGHAAMARLCHNGVPLAVILGYIANSKFDFYLMGTSIRETSVVGSPGIALHLLLSSHLAKCGITQYDYLAGRSQYKRQFSTDLRSFVRLHVARRTWRNDAGLIVDLARRTALKVSRWSGRSS